MLFLLPGLLWTFLVFPLYELPGSWLGRFKLAEDALEAERFEAAIDYLEACLQLVPRNATTAYHLACAHARERRIDEAMDWLEKSVDWGWVDAAVMRWDESLEPLQESVRFDRLAERAAVNKGASKSSMHLVDPFENLVYWAAWKHDEGISVSPDGDRLLAGDTLWDLRSTELVAVLRHAGEEVEHSFFAGSGDVVVTISRSSVRLWREKDGSFEPSVVRIDKSGVLGLCEEGLILFLNDQASNERARPPENKLSSRIIPIGLENSKTLQIGFYYIQRKVKKGWRRWQKWAVSPGGKCVLTRWNRDEKNSNGIIRLWDGVTGNMIEEYDYPDHYNFSFSRDGSHAVLTNFAYKEPPEKSRYEVSWIDAKDGTVLLHKTWKADNYRRSCVVDNRGRLLTIHPAGIVRWWSPGAKEPVRSFEIPLSGDVDVSDLSIVISPDGSRLVINADWYSKATTYPMQLLDLDTGTFIRKWPRGRYKASFNDEILSFVESPLTLSGARPAMGWKSSASRTAVRSEDSRTCGCSSGDS